MSKTYAVVEVFETLQGEGRWAGRRAVFVRFAGCNMWNGIPADRAKGAGACARWCDTNFVGGDKMSADELVAVCNTAWTGPRGHGSEDSPMVVVSGGEPTLQFDSALARELNRAGWFIAIETNGTKDSEVLRACDHVCVSPKKGSTLAVWAAHELKVVLPGGISSEPESQWTDGELATIAARGHWGARFVQPQDITNQAAVEDTHLHTLRVGAGTVREAQLYDHHVRVCRDFIRANPGWRLSVQQHKYLGLR